jgi:hypothetical protein
MGLSRKFGEVVTKLLRLNGRHAAQPDGRVYADELTRASQNCFALLNRENKPFASNARRAYAAPSAYEK